MKELEVYLDKHGKVISKEELLVGAGANIMKLDTYPVDKGHIIEFGMFDKRYSLFTHFITKECISNLMNAVNYVEANKPANHEDVLLKKVCEQDVYFALELAISMKNDEWVVKTWRKIRKTAFDAPFQEIFKRAEFDLERGTQSNYPLLVNLVNKLLEEFYEKEMKDCRYLHAIGAALLLKNNERISRAFELLCIDYINKKDFKKLEDFVKSNSKSEGALKAIGKKISVSLFHGGRYKELLIVNKIFGFDEEKTRKEIEEFLRANLEQISIKKLISAKEDPALRAFTTDLIEQSLSLLIAKGQTLRALELISIIENESTRRRVIKIGVDKSKEKLEVGFIKAIISAKDSDGELVNYCASTLFEIHLEREPLQSLDIAIEHNLGEQRVKSAATLACKILRREKNPLKELSVAESAGIAQEDYISDLGEEALSDALKHNEFDKGRGIIRAFKFGKEEQRRLDLAEAQHIVIRAKAGELSPALLSHITKRLGAEAVKEMMQEKARLDSMRRRANGEQPFNLKANGAKRKV